MQNVEPTRTARRLNSTEPRRRPRLLLFLSLSLNLGLFLFLVLGPQKSPSQAPPTELPDSTKASERIPTRNTRRGGDWAAHASRWKQFESRDLALYAANLRAAGCPERTVRNILLPLVEEKFQPPQSLTSEPTNFWASFSQRQVAANARAEQDSALATEKDNAIKDLLGFAWTSEGLKEASAEEAAEIGYLDYERAEKVVCIADRFRKQFSRVNRLYRSDVRSAVYEQWRQEVAGVLTPTECQETELREILTICQRENPNLCRIGLSGSELRQLMSFRRELSDPDPLALLAKSDEPLAERDWGTEQRLNAKVRSLLGEGRFLEYLKNCDVSFERILTTLEKEHLPPNFALQLFDLREEAMARAQEIRQLPLRRAERRARLAALRQRAIEQLEALPKGVTDNLLVRINQDWIQEIANP